MESGMHEFEAHTSEVQVRVQATTLPELFEEAALALADIMLGEAHPQAPADAEEEIVLVEAGDLDALLVDFLNELIYRSDAHKKVYTDVDVELTTEHQVRARIRGIVPDVLKTAVKAATFHGLDVHEHENGFDARIVLDV